MIYYYKFNMFAMKRFYFFLVLFFPGLSLFSQDFEKLTDSYLGINALGFTQPAVDIFSGMVNTGLHNEIAIPKKFYFKIDLVASAAFVSEKQKYFTARTDESFSPYQEVPAPTIVGPNVPVSVTGNGGATYVFPGGLGLSYVPVATPQITVGGILGSEILVRFMGVDIKDKIGKVQFLGLGIRHDIGQYFANGTVDISFGYYYQNFKVASYLNNSNHYFELGVGKKFSIIDLYAMIGYQASNMHVTYQNNDQRNNVDFTLNAKNPLRGGIGVCLDFNLLHFFVEGHYTNQLVATAGLGFKF